MIYSKLLEVAKRFEIEIIIDKKLKRNQGNYAIGRKIYVGDNPNCYTVLHEIGHAIYGYGCCREHDEYIAHGIAIGLAKAFGITLQGQYRRLIDPYAGRSARRACMALVQRRDKNVLVRTKRKR